MRIEYTTKCPECGGKMISGGTRTTLVGYFSPPGHNHDDNCVKRTYHCTVCAHNFTVSKQKRCIAEGCEWVGAKTCFCSGEKVVEWPQGFVEKL